MTSGEISVAYRRIAQITTRYEFTHPIGPADLDLFARLLRAAAPEYAPSVTLVAPDRVLVEVRDGPRRFYARTMVAISPT